MQDDQSFRPGGRTAMLMGSSASPLVNVMMSTAPRGDIVYLIYNTGAVDAYIGYGMTSGAANANAVVPSAGNAINCLPVPAGIQRAFTLSPMLFFAAQTPSANSQIMITPGTGV